MITRSPAPTVIADNVALPPKVPALPADVIARFPSLANWETDTTRWYKKLSGAIQDANRTISQTQTKTDTATRNLVLSANGISASVVAEREARITADEALAFDILTLTASVSSDVATLTAAISTESSTRATADTAIALTVTNLTSTVSTNLTNTNAAIASEASTRATADTAIALSVTNLTSTVNTNNTTVTAAINAEASTRATADTAIALSVTNLTATVNTNNSTLTAAVSTEASARATADGFLSGKYTLTVTAGNVATGFNITSSTGGGSNVSNVAFTTGAFQIYDGSSTSYPVFSATAGVVTLAGTLVVNTSGKVFIGTGTYANSNTAFYVDSTGQFSLKDKLTWDGTTLTINGGGTFSGALSAASGTFTGSLSAATGSFAGSLSAATGSFAGSLSAATGTFAGSLSAATGTFAGDLSASGGTFAGSLSAATGTFAGSLSAATGSFSGTLSAATGSFSGSITSTSGTIGGFDLSSTGIGNELTGINSVYLSTSSGAGKVAAGSFATGQYAQLYVSSSGQAELRILMNSTSVVAFINANQAVVGPSTFKYATLGVGDTSNPQLIYMDGLSGGISGTSLTTTGDVSVGGTLKFGSHSAIGVETLTGFMTVKDAGGTNRKVAIIS